MTESTSRPRKSRGRWILLAIVLALGGGAYYVRYHTGQNAMTFDRTRWLGHETDERGTRIRYYMIGDLLRRHQLVGMTRQEVEALLGPATRESQNGMYPYPGWDLGLMPGWGNTHSTALCLEFGPDGRVVKVWNPGR